MFAPAEEQQQKIWKTGWMLYSLFLPLHKIVMLVPLTLPWLLFALIIISCSVISGSLQPHGLQPTRHLCPWNSPGKNTGVGSHSLLQWDLPDPRVEPGSPTLQADSLPSEPPEKPRGLGYEYAESPILWCWLLVARKISGGEVLAYPWQFETWVKG